MNDKDPEDEAQAPNDDPLYQGGPPRVTAKPKDPMDQYQMIMEQMIGKVTDFMPRQYPAEVIADALGPDPYGSKKVTITIKCGREEAEGVAMKLAKFVTELTDAWAEGAKAGKVPDSMPQGMTQNSPLE